MLSLNNAQIMFKNVITFCSIKILQTLSILFQQSICHIKNYKTFVPQTPFCLDQEGINNLVNNQSQTQKKKTKKHGRKAV